MRNHNILQALLFSFSFYAQSQSVSEPEEAGKKLKTFSQQLDSLRKANHIPGLAAAVVKDQKLVWSKGYGSSHFDTGDGATFKNVTPGTSLLLDLLY